MNINIWREKSEVTLSRKTARKVTVIISALSIVNRRIVYCSTHQHNVARQTYCYF